MGGHDRRFESKKPKRPVATFVPREEWGAEKIKGRVVHLKTPVKYIRYGHTGTDKCRTKNKCISILQQYQKMYIEKGFADQPFNFLIGHDGLIYEGRGWAIEADRHEKIHRKIRGNSIDFAYIGDFSDEKPPKAMLEVADLLVDYGLEEKYIEQCPKILILNDYVPLIEDDD